MEELPNHSSTSLLNRLRLEVVFAILALTAGLFMVFLNAPFEAPDEASHFWRAYHVSEGNLVSTRCHDLSGGWIPKSITHAHLPFENLVAHPENRIEKNAIRNGLREPFADQPQEFICMGFAALYSPVVYIPQAVGIAIGKACGLSPLGMMYIGRIMNLFFWVSVSFIAIRITPVFKWVFVLISLLPMNVFLASSLSADAPADGIASLLFAFVLLAISRKETLPWSHMLAMTLLCILLSFIKLPYVPLTGMVFLIPAARFGGLRNKLLWCGGTIALSFLATMLWSTAIKGLYVPLHDANAPEQMALLMKHPWTFPILAIRSFEIHAGGIFISFIGKLGFLDTAMPTWIYVTYPLVLVIVAVFEFGGDCIIKWPQRLWIIFLCVGVFLLIELSMFLTWTPVGGQVIEGVQGRYFLPIAVPAMLALFYNYRFKISNQKFFSLLISLYSILVLSTMCWTVYMRYYSPVS
jgi:uncharacterized membrane protein